VKALLRNAIRASGYEIARANRFGVKPLKDIRKIFGTQIPRTVFDVGANEGQTAIEFAKEFPGATIYSFEPFGNAFCELQRVAARLPQITPVQSALGQTIGSQTLFLNAASVTNSLLPNAPEAAIFQPEGMALPAGSTTVPVSTVDDYCRQHGIQWIDVLKTDTQGYDLSVLVGAEQLIAAQKVSAIFVELLFAPLYSGQSNFQDIYAHLWGRGFKLVNFYSVSWNEQNYASWCDGLFVHPDALALASSKPQR
jgi:FkbM family methyltransferase